MQVFVDSKRTKSISALRPRRDGSLIATNSFHVHPGDTVLNYEKSINCCARYVLCLPSVHLLLFLRRLRLSPLYEDVLRANLYLH